ncbi:MAG: DUF6263 family protein [Bacteroidota bacterium]|nr:DUF6263 family protein [Bacteroidota bacterium]
MKKISLLILVMLVVSIAGISQKISGKLVFQQGQIIGITMDVKSTFSQEAMGNAIDFSINGTAAHAYKVTNATEDNTTLHHDVKKITFLFDGMGTKRSFDSDNKKDMEGMFGPTIKEMMTKTFDMIINPAGKVLLVKPEKITLAKPDDRLAIVTTMLKDVTAVIYPPKKNEASFFKVLPEKETSITDSWTESGEDSVSRFNTTYTLAAMTDSTLIVNLKGTSVSNTSTEMMGARATTTMKNNYTGKIILDKATGILREKTIEITSAGSTEAMGGTVPVTSKTTITIRVKPQ